MFRALLRALRSGGGDMTGPADVATRFNVDVSDTAAERAAEQYMNVR